MLHLRTNDSVSYRSQFRMLSSFSNDVTNAEDTSLRRFELLVSIETHWATKSVHIHVSGNWDRTFGAGASPARPLAAWATGAIGAIGGGAGAATIAGMGGGAPPANLRKGTTKADMNKRNRN